MSLSSLTRFAPTPSGYLHLGNIFSFALTAALAKQRGEQILLRIDDMDRERYQPEFLDDIFESLNYMGLQWDQGPTDRADFEARYSQVHRLQLYHSYLQQLADEKRVFACTCSRSDVIERAGANIYDGHCRRLHLPLDTPGAAWRLDTDDKRKATIRLMDNTRQQLYLPSAVRYFIVRKKDGHPAYQLCSVADDQYYGTSLIVRGADLFASTMAQAYLAELMHLRLFEDCSVAHHPILADDLGEKMSKSAGSTSIHFLRKQGVSAAAIYEMIEALRNQQKR